jgi:hypothetical protein
MEQSEKLCKRVEEIKAQIEQGKKSRIKMIEDSRLQSVVSRLITAQYVLEPNDSALLKLRGEIAEIKAQLYAPEKELLTELNATEKELRSLTGPEIASGVERLNRELIGLKPYRKVTGRTRGGFDMTNRVEVEGNEEGIYQVQRLIQEGRETLNRMLDDPIEKIKDFVAEQIRKIKAVDLTVKRRVITEAENERLEFLNSPPTIR